MRANYETAFERETDLVCEIVERNPHKNEYAAFVAPVHQQQRKSAKCVRAARKILGIACTVCATLTVVAALNGAWQSAFAGSAMLIVALLSARITE